MTNPDNIVRVRARNGGRASVYEANGWAQAYSDGLLEFKGGKFTLFAAPDASARIQLIPPFSVQKSP